ncbi:MAG TPA: hypothetical protein VFR58_17175 [Flavisolibacter sp.]|nr:hypothetical protein [Flavisolibacter sp.]
MTPLFKKLNLKNQSTILVLNPPASFEGELENISGFVKVERKEGALAKIDFAIVFVTTQAQIEDAIKKAHPKLEGDAILWFCYPKGSSKKYSCEFNRDTGWAVLGGYGLEGVRQVSIDEDWSAIRFRKVEYIKQLTRRESFALSAEGKSRAGKKTGR